MRACDLLQELLSPPSPASPLPRIPLSPLLCSESRDSASRHTSFSPRAGISPKKCPHGRLGCNCPFSCGLLPQARLPSAGICSNCLPWPLPPNPCSSTLVPPNSIPPGFPCVAAHTDCLPFDPRGLLRSFLGYMSLLYPPASRPLPSQHLRLLLHFVSAPHGGFPKTLSARQVESN